MCCVSKHLQKDKTIFQSMESVNNIVNVLLWMAKQSL